MPRADGPAEGDDSKETNIAVVNPATEAGCARGSVDNDDWNLEGKLRMHRNKGMSGPHMLIKIIEDSKIPLGEEDAKLHSIKGRWSGTCHCRGRMRLSSLDWLRGRTSGRGERKAQRTLNPQTLCPDENGELGHQEMSSEDNEANGRPGDEEDEDEEVEDED